MDRRSRSITEWRRRLEAIRVETIRQLHENGVGHMRSLFREHPRGAGLNPNRGTEEYSKMAEKADDLGISDETATGGDNDAAARCRSAPPPRCASARPRITATDDRG